MLVLFLKQKDSFSHITYPQTFNGLSLFNLVNKMMNKASLMVLFKCYQTCLLSPIIIWHCWSVNYGTLYQCYGFLLGPGWSFCHRKIIC